MHLNHNIDLYLSEGLPPRAEVRLRSHLRECNRCRDYYDRQVIVHRALAGNPDVPTPQEEERLLRLVMQSTGFRLSEQQPEQRPGLMGRILWAPAPALAVAFVVLVFTFAGLIYKLVPTSLGGPVIAAHLTGGRNIELNGKPVDVQTADELFVLEGAELAVGRGGFAKLSLQRGGSVRVFPGSTLSLSGPGEVLELSSGKVWCLVDPSGAWFADAFMVKTDVAEVRAIGTSFLVERRQSGETDVSVAKGVVEVRDIETGEAVRIEGCHRMRVIPGSSPHPPGRYTPKYDRYDWNVVLGKMEKPHQ